MIFQGAILIFPQHPPSVSCSPQLMNVESLLSPFQHASLQTGTLSLPTTWATYLYNTIQCNAHSSNHSHSFRGDTCFRLQPITVKPTKCSNITTRPISSCYITNRSRKPNMWVQNKIYTKWASALEVKREITFRFPQKRTQNGQNTVGNWVEILKPNLPTQIDQDSFHLYACKC